MRRSLCVVTCCLMLLASACLTRPAGRPAAQPNPPEGDSQWQGVDLPGMPEASRTAVYDRARDAIWIVSQIYPQVAGNAEYATVTRLDASTRKVTQTGLELDSNFFYGASAAVDADDNLWMAWGRKLFEYKPADGTVQRHDLPSWAALGVGAPGWSGGGNFQSLVIDDRGELWTVADEVPALFGFNPTLGKWDRVIHMRWQPSQIASPRAGTLTVSGARSPDGKVFIGKFAEVNVATGRVHEYNFSAGEYALVDAHTAVFTDAAGNIGRLDIDTGDATILYRNPPTDEAVGMFAVGGEGKVWFAMGTGIGMVNVASGLVSHFSYPPVVPTKPVQNTCVPPHGWGTCTLPCPTGVDSCIPKPYVPAADVYALTVDSAGNVWAVTNRAGSDDPHIGWDYCGCPPLLAVLEFKAAAA